MSAVHRAMSELSAHARAPGVAFGPESSGWCGVYLPFPIASVVDCETLGPNGGVENSDRAALQIIATMLNAFRPDRALLTGVECEVIDIMKAAVQHVIPRKIIA